MQTTEILKTNTAQFHDAIEAKLESKRLFDGSFTQDNYYKMLLVNHQFIKAYESEIETFLNDNDKDLLNRINFDKLSLLEKDLEELKLTPYEMLPINHLNNRAEALGALYVIEGSMLGGMVIAKQLKKYPELENSNFNYFGHYGQDIGPIWKAFVAYLNEQIVTDEDKADILKGAIKAYEYLIMVAS
ncbi:biliverdin-producing heme oxygenase [Faecalibacter rhinopitheci]|uniref:Biliverdin-producing heme oxygenase n=1 Tax=Faecalibacter rhinopitheci TaxID=2779678 RepID=A0A8J7K9J8_9FLAO|nr:biliverdin-producing heme oxygenase [Faecalibacter rhinopitheci]MBF0596245.1 biliverdin-producing heme oxygenase [Faecalibacter rhinopitheci]